MIAATLASLVLALGPSALEVTGDATCPTPGEVAQRVDELFPAVTGAKAGGPARVIVTRNGPALRLVLLGANANELASRELPGEGSCADLAAAATVVVGAWLANLDPNLSSSIRLPTNLAEQPPLAPPPRAIPVVSATPAPLPHPTAFAFGLGLVASETGGALAPGAMLLAALGLTPRVGLEASLTTTTSRAAAVGALADAASWSRVTFGLGPSFSLGTGRVRGSLHAEALAALLRVRGVGVPSPASDTTGELGGALGARLEVPTGTSAVWLGLDVLGWPGDQRLIIRNFEGDGRLSRLEIVAAMGIALGRFP